MIVLRVVCLRWFGLGISVIGIEFVWVLKLISLVFGVMQACVVCILGSFGLWFVFGVGSLVYFVFLILVFLGKFRDFVGLVVLIVGISLCFVWFFCVCVVYCLVFGGTSLLIWNSGVVCGFRFDFSTPVLTLLLFGLDLAFGLFCLALVGCCLRDCFVWELSSSGFLLV